MILLDNVDVTLKDVTYVVTLQASTTNRLHVTSIQNVTAKLRRMSIRHASRIRHTSLVTLGLHDFKRKPTKKRTPFSGTSL